LTATITPTSATSKILIMVTIGGYAQGTGQGRFILTRAGSNISQVLLEMLQEQPQGLAILLQFQGHQAVRHKLLVELFI